MTYVRILVSDTEYHISTVFQNTACKLLSASLAGIPFRPLIFLATDLSQKVTEPDSQKLMSQKVESYVHQANVNKDQKVSPTSLLNLITVDGCWRSFGSGAKSESVTIEQIL
jgi:hypothetical protein